MYVVLSLCYRGQSKFSDQSAEKTRCYIFIMFCMQKLVMQLDNSLYCDNFNNEKEIESILIR